MTCVSTQRTTKAYLYPSFHLGHEERRECAAAVAAAERSRHRRAGPRGRRREPGQGSTPPAQGTFRGQAMPLWSSQAKHIPSFI
jgi:hypothetical protein